jgi:hypothetical protein
VREHHGPGRRVPSGEVGPHAAHRLGEHARVTGRVDAQRLARRLRFEVRDPVQRNGSVLVGEHHRPVELGGAGAQVQPAGRGETGERAQPRRRVVVARSDNQSGARRPDPVEYASARRHGLARRHRAVVEVAGNHDDVDPLVDDEVGQAAEHRLLVRQQVPAVEHPSHMPVGGVQHPHAVKLGRAPAELGEPRHYGG